MLRIGERLSPSIDRSSLNSGAVSGAGGAQERNTRAKESGVGPHSAHTGEAAQNAARDAGVEAYEAAAQQLAAAAAGKKGASTNDPQVAAVIAEMKSTDTAVRAHEAAHVMVGGSYVRGGASFTYATGPDGREYAVGGEVSIDTSAEGDPEATIRKMATVRAAALAPADPSAQDRAVAAAAAQAMAAAQSELREQRVAEADEAKASSEATNATPSLRVAAGASESTGSVLAREFGALAAATYSAASQSRVEPTFRAAA